MSSVAPLIHNHNLSGWGARVTQRCAPIRKHWQHAFGIRTRGDVARKYTGERPSEATKVLQTLDTLARSAGTTPWPLIADGIVVVTQAEIRNAPTQVLEARLAELNDVEHDLEAQENRATAASKNRLERADANIREAEIQLERAAIERELYEREQRA